MARKAQRKPRAKIEVLTGSVDRRAGNEYEVIAPDGWHFDCGSHVHIAGSLDEARGYAAETLERCDEWCSCQG